MRIFLAVLLSVSLLVAGQAPAQNPLLDKLTQEGIDLGQGDVVKLSPPVMTDGMSAAEQQQALAKAAGATPVAAMLERNLNAPFVLKIERLKLPSGRQTGRSVDLMFVAHGALQTIADRDLAGQILFAPEDAKEKQDPPSQARELTADELTKRSITVQPATEKMEEGYSIVDFPLLEKVQITGVGHSVTVKTDESVTAAAVLDQRFSNDPELPNRWRTIFRSDLGRVKLGAPNPYAGFAGYTKVTQLKEPAGTLLIEAHLAFEEPQGWFQGANYLGSKLPLVARNSVTSFRRKLNAASK